MLFLFIYNKMLPFIVIDLSMSQTKILSKTATLCLMDKSTHLLWCDIYLEQCKKVWIRASFLGSSMSDILEYCTVYCSVASNVTLIFAPYILLFNACLIHRAYWCNTYYFLISVLLSFLIEVSNVFILSCALCSSILSACMYLQEWVTGNLWSIFLLYLFSCFDFWYHD